MKIDEHRLAKARKAYDATHGSHRDALAAAILAYLSARSAGPVAWMHVMTYETGETNKQLSFYDENPFGKPGEDYSAEYPVEAIPLFDHPTPEASDV